MLVAEVRTRAFLASLVPVIVNAVLNEHQLVLDIVAFVALGDFPRSRLGEKQRGRVLANWVSRKMRTIAQFGIRDPDAEGSVSTIGPDDVNMGRRGSGQSGLGGRGSLAGAPGSSLRHVESITQMPVEEEPLDMDDRRLTLQTQNDGAPPIPDRSDSRNDATPTNETPRPYELSTTVDYSPVEPYSFDSPEQMGRGQPDYRYQMQSSYAGPDSFDPYNDRIDAQELEGSGAGLRVANLTSSSGSDDWEQEALRSMNIGR